MASPWPAANPGFESCVTRDKTPSGQRSLAGIAGLDGEAISLNDLCGDPVGLLDQILDCLRIRRRDFIEAL
jgi:hypothetical protein